MIKALLAFALSIVGFAAGAASAPPDRFSDTTTLHYSGGHGSQVVYMAPGGTSYLWYPGNRVVLKARWKLERQQVCYQYGADTYNPVTRKHGGDWQCVPRRFWRDTVVEQLGGDLFGLSGRREVPFVLSRERTTLANLARPSIEHVVADYTILHFDPKFGSKVVYFAPDGTAHLWFPGHRPVIRAFWKVDRRDLCVQLPKGIFFPISTAPADEWSCTSIARREDWDIEKTRGDIFGLVDREQVPFDMPPGRTSLDALAGRPVPLVDEQPSAEVRAFNEFIRGLTAACPGMSQFLDMDRVILWRAIANAHFWGGLYTASGVPDGCISVDYRTAFAIYRAIGDAEHFEGMVEVLKEKAAAGEPKAVAALQTLDLTPLN